VRQDANKGLRTRGEETNDKGGEEGDGEVDDGLPWKAIVFVPLVPRTHHQLVVERHLGLLLCPEARQPRRTPHLRCPGRDER